MWQPAKRLGGIMRLFSWFGSLIVAIGIAAGAVSMSPSSCSSHPCTYTITCAAATCNATEVGEVHCALNGCTSPSVIPKAHRGDTIKLQAGRLFPLTSKFAWKFVARTGDSDANRSDYLTVTTTSDASLPNRSVRVTQHHSDLMPTIRVRGQPNGIYFAGNATPASHVKLRGLRVISGNSQAITVGNTNNLDGYDIAHFDQQPKDIWIEQCIVQAEDMMDSGTQHIALSVDARKYPTGLLSNWMSYSWHKSAELVGRQYYGNETQIIEVNQVSKGLIPITNNYLGDTSGQNIMLGGTGPPFNDPDALETVSPYPTVHVINNSLVNHPERLTGKKIQGWEANTQVFKGRTIKVDNDVIWVAQNTGVTGASRPDWASKTALGDTLPDNDITWVRYYVPTSSDPPQALQQKALIESKNGSGMLMWNHLWMFGGVGQTNMGTIKLASCPKNGSGQCQCKPFMTGTVNTNGTIVTSANGAKLPDLLWTSEPFAKTISIGGTWYTVSDFDTSDPNRLVLTASAGNQSGATYLYRYETPPSGCSNALRWPAMDESWLFAFNLASNGNEFISHVQQPYPMTWNTGDKAYWNNLIHKQDCEEWRNCSIVRGGHYFSQYTANFKYVHNTYIDGASTASGQPMAAASGYTDRKFGLHYWQSNVGHKQGGASGGGLFDLAASSIFDSYFCSSGTCRTGNNIFGGYALTGLPSATYGTNWNLCSGTAGCSTDNRVDMDYSDTTRGKLYWDWSKRILVVRSPSITYPDEGGAKTHPYHKGGHDAVDVGASFVNVPMIRPTQAVDVKLSGWAAATNYDRGATITESSMVFVALRGGTSGSTEPAFSTCGSSGSTCLRTDGDVIWSFVEVPNWEPTIRVSTTKAVFEFIPHAPSASIPCSLEVSSTIDMDSPIADLNGAYSLKASDDHDSYPRDAGIRRIIVGRNVGLSANTTYYYRLHCGGALREGAFHTAANVTGTTLTASRYVLTAGTYTISYGSVYSRATNTLSGGGSSTVSCSANASCTFPTVSIPADVTWWRVTGPGGYSAPIELAMPYIRTGSAEMGMPEFWFFDVSYFDSGFFATQ